MVKSVRMPALHWAFVCERAKLRDLTPNGWIVRMVEEQMRKRGVLVDEPPKVATPVAVRKAT